MKHIFISVVSFQSQKVTSRYYFAYFTHVSRCRGTKKVSDLSKEWWKDQIFELLGRLSVHCTTGILDSCWAFQRESVLKMFREQRGKLHIELQEKEVKKLEPSHTAVGDIKYVVQPLWKTAWQFLKMLTVKLLYDQQFHPRKMKTYIHTKTCTRMHIATLFIIAKNFKQPKFLSIDEWINKMVCIHAMEYHLVIKRNKIMTHATTWINLKNVRLSERSTKDHILCDPIDMKCPK